MEKVKVGVIGCGRISEIYLKNCTNVFNYILDVTACADLLPEAARDRAQTFGISRACSVEELLADPEIDVVLNLTNPWAHYEVNMAALKAGKHVYVEKPLAMNREQALEMRQFAKSKGLLIGCAPDTFLGAGLQTCRKLLDEGWIGTPVAANAMVFLAGGNERYDSPRVGGTILDMGPYYITALVHLLGPVKRVAGSAITPLSEKVAKSKKTGLVEKYKPGTPTTVTGILEFENNVVANLLATNDVCKYENRLEILGTEGILVCNDPNFFSKSIYIKRRVGEVTEVPLTHPFAENSRGLGLADMAHAILNNRKHRANDELAYHVLDVLLSFSESSEKGIYSNVESTCERPAPFAAGHLNNPML